MCYFKKSATLNVSGSAETFLNLERKLSEEFPVYIKKDNYEIAFEKRHVECAGSGGGALPLRICREGKIVPSLYNLKRHGLPVTL